MDEYFKLISLDVVSLFTNVPIDLVVDSIIKKYIEKKCVTSDEFLAAVRCVLNFSFFTFNGIYYRRSIH